MADARLYEVRTQTGTVYVLLDVATGMVSTERSELAARRLASDRGLSITDAQSITHEELLRLMGHEPVAKAPVTPSSPAAESRSTEPAKQAKPATTANPFSDVPAAQLPFSVRYYLEDESGVPFDDGDVIARPDAPRVNSVFCSEGEITPKIEPTPPEHAGDVSDSNKA
jgi:hypothetical protein